MSLSGIIWMKLRGFYNTYLIIALSRGMIKNAQKVRKLATQIPKKTKSLYRDKNTIDVLKNENKSLLSSFCFGLSSSETRARVIWSLGDKVASNHHYHHHQCHQLSNLNLEFRDDKSCHWFANDFSEASLEFWNGKLCH